MVEGVVGWKERKILGGFMMKGREQVDGENLVGCWNPLVRTKECE
jgi:hypothetical protein